MNEQTRRNNCDESVGMVPNQMTRKAKRKNWRSDLDSIYPLKRKKSSSIVGLQQKWPKIVVEGSILFSPQTTFNFHGLFSKGKFVSALKESGFEEKSCMSLQVQICEHIWGGNLQSNSKEILLTGICLVHRKFNPTYLESRRKQHKDSFASILLDLQRFKATLSFVNLVIVCLTIFWHRQVHLP